VSTIAANPAGGANGNPGEGAAAPLSPSFSRPIMTHHRSRLLAALLATAVLAGCATSAPEPVEARSEPVYRTGSNIPVKGATASRVEVYKPDVVPTSPTMPPPRQGGG